MRALVTGGGGFLGGAIVRRLVARGDRVLSLSRRRYPDLDALGVAQRLGDVADPRLVRDAVAGCDIVFHVAAKAGLGGRYGDYHRTNVTGTENVLEACRREGVRRLVYTSSPSVVFDGRDMEGVNESVPYPPRYQSPYPQTKALAERLVRSGNGRDLATVALRPHLIWGPGDNHLVPRILARARAGRLRRIGRKSPLIDSTFIDNAADAHLLAGDRLSPGCPLAGRVYFVSNGEPLQLWDLVNRILAAAGLDPVTRCVPFGVAYAAGWVLESANKLLSGDREPAMTRFLARELSTAHWFDIAAARRDLGYTPNVTTKEGLRRLTAHFKSDLAR
jgi:nucleoside-diphosphate-sugar epimerase